MRASTVARVGQTVGLIATGSFVLGWAVAPASAQTVARALPFNGLSIGWGFGHDSFHAPMSVSSYDDYNSDAFSRTVKGTSGFFTAEIGRDFRVGNMVWGIYADYTHGSKPGSISHEYCTSHCITTTGTVELNDSASLIGRGGMLIDPTLLLYGLAGITAQNTTTRVTGYSTYWGDLPTATRNDTLTGVIVGFGAEKMLMPFLSAKGEYRFAQFGSIGSLGATDGPTYVNGTVGNVTDHIFRLVLSYKVP